MSTSTAVHVEPKPSELPLDEPIMESVGPPENETEESDCDTVPAINDLKSLKKGIIKTSRNKAQVYTILLVGETGTGKTSLLEFIANVLIGKSLGDYDFDLLDKKNEQGGSTGQSQTNSARLYELTSKNGILVRILDAPGLADTRGVNQDELHKESIATEIQSHIDSVTAVLILANGSVPRITVGMDYALSALSALFPKTLAKNIAFLFSNSQTYLSLNFAQDAIPNILKGAPQYLIDNPIALQRKFLEFKDDPNKKKMRKEIQRDMANAELRALEMLCDLFDWLDNLEPQPTTEIVALYKKSHVIESKITDTLTQMDQASNQMAKINEIVEELQKKSADVDGLSKFEKIINALVWKQRPASTLNYLCITPDCHSTCGVKRPFAGVFLLWPRQFSSCSECNHPHLSHFHLPSTWEQVYEAQLAVDDDMRKRWEAAKDEKERTEALLVTSKSALEDLSRIIDEAMDDLARLAEEYASLSLSGSFSAPLEKAIWLLEQRCRGMEEKGVGPEQLTKVRTSLARMKGRLELLRKAKGKAKGVKRIVKVRKGEEKVHKTFRTIEDELQEDVSIFWGAIKKKVKAGFRK